MQNFQLCSLRANQSSKTSAHAGERQKWQGFDKGWRFNWLATTGVATIALILSGCSANNDPSHLFVESANAEPVDTSVVNDGANAEKFSDIRPSAKTIENFAIERVAGNAFLEKGQQVNEIRYDELQSLATWQYSYYVNYPVSIAGEAGVGHRAQTGVGYITKTTNDAQWEFCGGIPAASSLNDELRYPPAAPEICALKDIETQFYQKAGQLTVEYYCGESLVSARNYRMVANDKVAQTQLEFSQLTPPQDYSDSDACLEVTNYWVDIEGDQVNTVADIYGSILSNSYHIQFQLNHANADQSFFTLDSTAGEETHDFIFNFSPFGRYSSTQKETGFVLWEKTENPLSVNAEFEMVVHDVVAGERHVEGAMQSAW